MSKSTPSIIDCYRGESVEWVADFCATWPNSWISKRIMGDHPTYWRLSTTSASSITSWMDLGFDRRSGRVPGSYASAAVLECRGDLTNSGAGSPAVAYRLGSAAMVAVLPKGARSSNFDCAADHNQGTQIALRVGRETLMATMGTWYEYDESFVPTPHVVTHLNDGQRVDIANIAQQFPGAVVL